MRSTPIERNSGVRIYQPFLGTFLVLFSIFFPTYSAASETKTTSDWLNHIVKLTNQKSCYFEILKIWRKRPRFFLKMVCGYRPMQARTGYTGHRNCFFFTRLFSLGKIQITECSYCSFPGHICQNESLLDQICHHHSFNLYLSVVSHDLRD